MKVFTYIKFSIFTLFFAMAVLGGLYLNLRLHVVFGDALARSYHIYQVFFGTHPKLSAIGFVWPPMQTLVQLPFAWISSIHYSGIIGNITSAIFFILSLFLLERIAKFFNVSTVVRYIGILLMFINPMMYLYGINGMSEIIGIFFYLLTLYFFLKYISSENILFLIVSAFGLSLGIMTRWEMFILLPIFLVILFAQHVTQYKIYLSRFESNGILYIFPIACIIAGWLLISYFVTGNFFPAAEQIDNNLGDGLNHIVAKIDHLHLFMNGLAKVFFLAPLVPIISLLAMIISKNKNRFLVATVLGSGLSLVFAQVVLYTLGKTVGELRYFMFVIPTTWIVAMICISALKERFSIIAQKIITTAILLLVFLSSITAGYAMSNNQLNNQEYIVIDALKRGTNSSQYYNYEHAKDIAAYLTNNIHQGKILVDDKVGFSIIYFTQNSSLFIQSIDENFSNNLKFPFSNSDLKYFLVNKPTSEGSGVEDIVNTTYPNLFAEKESFTKLVHDFGDWKLFEIGNFVQEKPIAQPKDCYYTTNEGDSYWSISEKVYGDGADYPNLLQLNELSQAKQNMLEVGQQVKVPCDTPDTTNR